MRFLKTKVCIAVFFVIFAFFFTNDFGLIDIEKTAIITAVAIDKADNGEYEVSTQIAVHEATDQNEEKRKALVTGKGSTIGKAIKDIGNVSGWFPKLSFCNLILISEDFKDTNVIRILDYFSKTLRVQDSALVCMTEKKAKDVLDATSPLDQISSFAIQKILLKNPGFDKDVIPMDIRTFTAGYYSDCASSYMPYIKLNTEVISSNDQNTTGSNQSSNQGNGGSNSTSSNAIATLFDATSTSLFVKGKMVGKLDRDLTWTLNLFLSPEGQNTFDVNNVDSQISGANYLLTIIRNNPKLDLHADKNKITLTMNLDLYCKISDQDTNYSDTTFTSNSPLPLSVKEKAENILTQRTQKLFNIQTDTGCDFLGLKKQLYRYHYSYYSRYKDNFNDLITANISVKVNGQK